MLRGISTLFFVALVVATSGDVSAQDVSPEKLYGNGVHAFHSGDYYNAHSLLSASIDKGNDDPRCYYFRGVALRRMGRRGEAAYDFQVGVELESKLGEPVGASLERIQGSDRIVLEKYRRQLANARALSSRVRANRAKQSPGDVLPSFDVRRSRPTEVPQSTGLTSLDPADPYTNPTSIFDSPVGTGVDVIVASEVEDQPDTDALDEVDSLAGTGIDDFGSDDAGNEELTSDASGDIFDLEDTGDDLADMSIDADFDLDSPDDSPPKTTASKSSGGGALGSIFRALSRAATPKVDISKIQDQLPIPGAGPGGPPGGFPGGPGPGGEIPPDNSEFQNGPPGGNPFKDDPL